MNPVRNSFYIINFNTLSFFALLKISFQLKFSNGMKKLYPILTILLIILSVSAGAGKNFVQIKGSDTMVNLAQAWAEKYMELNPQDFISVTGGGSGTGLSSLISGTCDIAMSSRNIKNKEVELAGKKGINPYEIKAALDGLAVVVNPKNPVDKLTIEQLAQIFTGKITNFKQVGGRDCKIVILSREVNSGTHVYFKEHVLRKNDPSSTEEFAPSALMLPSSQAIADEVAGNPAAIGYYGMGYISDKQKAVSIAKDPNSEFIAPAVDNVTSGKYPISRPLFLYTNGRPQGLVKKFVDFALSKEGQDIVTKTDFVPTPPHQNTIMSPEPNTVTGCIPTSKKLWAKHIQFWCGGK